MLQRHCRIFTIILCNCVLTRAGAETSPPSYRACRKSSTRRWYGNEHAIHR